MSLYNNIESQLSSGNLMGSIKSSIGNSIGGLAAQASSAMGGGRLASRVANIGASMATNAATSLVNKYLPPQVQRALNTGAGALGDVLSGNWEGAGIRLLDSGLLNGLFPGLTGLNAQARYWGTPTPLFGGVSPTEAKQIYESARSAVRAKKNLWLLEVSSRLMGDASERFNLFCTEVDYSPFGLTGDKRRVGGAVIDAVQGNEPVEFRMTTLDDESGFIKHWFAAHHAAVAAQDGTVGVPDSYAIRIRVVHAFISASSNRGGYEDIGLFRPASLEVSLSRREDGLQEVQLSFSQLDTFMAV